MLELVPKGLPTEDLLLLAFTEFDGLYEAVDLELQHLIQLKLEAYLASVTFPADQHLKGGHEVFFVAVAVRPHSRLKALPQL